MRLFMTIVLALATLPAFAEEMTAPAPTGNDALFSGQEVQISQPTENDLFASGFDIDVDETVNGDAHLVGFKLDLNAPVEGNIYTFGSFIDISAPINGDLTASGFALDLAKTTEIAGNARLAARRVTVDGTIDGSMSIATDTLTLNGTVAGDLKFFGRRIVFGNDAKISGDLKYQAPSKLDIPTSVVAENRVTFTPMQLSTNRENFEGSIDDVFEPFVPSYTAIALSILTTLAAIFILSALFLALIPDKIEHLRTLASTNFWRRLGFGFLALAMLLGLVPVAASTIVGAPFIPIIILIIGLAWLFGYVLGAYTIAHKVFGRLFKLTRTGWSNVFVLMGGLVVFPLLNFIPIIGWLFNLVLVFLGLGAVAQALVNKGKDSPEKGKPMASGVPA